VQSYAAHTQEREKGEGKREKGKGKREKEGNKGRKGERLLQGEDR
jgi:hypothetical protein